MKRIPPALVLFLLAPLTGELLSGSSPPVEFFNPFPLLILSALYGSGALLVRELTLRWNKRWPTIFVLGLAYGVLEEGIMVKSFFDPTWPDLGALAVYGCWAGVNWVWSLFLMIYHAIISIAVPILLVENIYLERRDAHWLGRRGMVGFTLLLGAVVLFAHFVLAPYRPPAAAFLLFTALAVGLVLVARRQPRVWMPSPHGMPRGPRFFGLLSFVGTMFFFLLQWLAPELGIPALFTMCAVVMLIALMVWIVRRLAGGGAWDDRHRLALASGALAFFIFIAPLSERDATRADNPAGMTLVGLVALVFLVVLYVRTRRRVQYSPPAEATTA
jgi:hypothetical protein